MRDFLAESSKSFSCLAITVVSGILWRLLCYDFKDFVLICLMSGESMLSCTFRSYSFRILSLKSSNTSLSGYNYEIKLLRFF